MILHCETAGVRLDVFLTQALEGMTRSAAQRLLEGNHVKKDGQPVKKNQKTEAGADYTVEIPNAQPIALQPEKIDLEIAYEDSDVVIINKPKGMVVHPAAGHWSGTLVNALLYHCGDSLSGINGQLRPGIVHRIDKDTSGLLLVAKNDFAHQKLAAQLADHTMHRTYVCLACGNIRDDNGVIDAPIARHPQDRKKWPSARMASVPSRIFRCWPVTRAIPMCSAVWKQGAPIRSGSIWPGRIIRFSAIRSTVIKSPSLARVASASMPRR